MTELYHGQVRIYTDEELKAEGITVIRAQSGAVMAYVLDYQVTDKGRAVGDPTRFQATSILGLVLKLKQAHISAAAAFYRLKRKLEDRAQQHI